MNLLEERSLKDPEVLEDPVAYHHALLEQPLYFDQRLGFHICSSYALLREILRDTDVYSSIASQSTDSLRQPPPQVVALRRAGYAPVDTLVTNDPPAHTRIRRMVDDPFRPRSIARLTASIRQIVDETLDAFIDQGECDAVADLAVPIPIKVIADMLGIERSLAPRIKAWSDASVEPLGMMCSDARLIECAHLVKEFQDFIAAELDARRRAPRDDLLSHLVTAQDEAGDGLSMAEMLSLTQQFLVAGNETTTNGIAAGVQLLIDNPRQLDALRGCDSKHVRTFVDEVLRLEAPVQGLFRVVRRETRIAGVTLPAGARVMLRFAAANRDPARYANPDDLDVTRANAGTHLAFGAGIHHCIGANLAREEMALTFEALLDRTDNLGYQPGRNDFRHHPSLILRGLEHLYIRFDRRR
jgi:cytochrome P450